MLDNMLIPEEGVTWTSCASLVFQLDVLYVTTLISRSSNGVWMIHKLVDRKHFPSQINPTSELLKLTKWNQGPFFLDKPLKGLFCCSHSYVISHLISNLSPLTNRHMVHALPRPWPRSKYAYPGTPVACYPTSLIPDL